MTKSELIERIVTHQGLLSSKDVELAIKTMLEQMSQCLATGDRIEIRGFGSFSLHYRAPRVGRNPKTGQSVSLDALAPAQVEAAYWKLMRLEHSLPRPVFVLAYDNLKGVWLDEGPRSLRGRIDLGSEPGDLPQLVGHNWSKPQEEAGTTFRRSRGRRSWLRIPVRTPGGFAAVLRARSASSGVPVTVAIQWNGRDVGTATLGDAWAEYAFTVPAEAVRAGFNDASIDWSLAPGAPDPGAEAGAHVDWLRLDRRFEGPLQRHY